MLRDDRGENRCFLRDFFSLEFSFLKYGDPKIDRKEFLQYRFSDTVNVTLKSRDSVERPNQFRLSNLEIESRL